MRISGFHIAAALMAGLLVTSWAMADQHMAQTPYGHKDATKYTNGIIGISLQVSAERIGDPSALYVGMVHPEGPAHQAGLRHGDEITSVDGTPVQGKSYEQVVKMIRGEAGTVVKVGVKDEKGLHELSIERVAGDKLKRPDGSHGRPE
ncbi:MAG: PDZ domain-containing protein [Nitrospira sp.]|nr:PDZ domain-containing protein [Nitrospira sp.]